MEGTKKEKIEINDLGNMWIDKETKGIYVNDNNKIILNGKRVYYYKNEKEKNAFPLYNLNPANDIS